jgi:hypothetical protein
MPRKRIDWDTRRADIICHRCRCEYKGSVDQALSLPNSHICNKCLDREKDEEKRDKELEKDYEKYLKEVYLKLVKYQMPSTGCTTLDEEVKRVCGDWTLDSNKPIWLRRKKK